MVAAVRTLALAVFAAAAAILLGTSTIAQEFGARGKPSRVVSLNLCLDQLVLMLAEPGNIASVTWLAADGFASVTPQAAAKVRLLNRGFAEEILPIRPDLVLAGAFTTPFTVQMLRRTGFNVEVLAVPTSLDDVREQIRLVGDLLRERPRAEAVVAAMDAILASAAPPLDAPRLRAAVFQPGGFTAAPGSFEHELLLAAGLSNIAAERGLKYYGYLSLEDLLLARPDLIVSPAYAPGRPSIAEQIVRHPALRRTGAAQRIVTIPSKLWNCAGPMNAEAVQILAEARG